ncbi:MAG: ubiquitin-like protein UBact [Nitrospiraceae bacterium]
MNHPSMLMGAGLADPAAASPTRTPFASLERRPFEPMPKPVSPSDDEGGPRRPETGSPEKDNLMKRMKKVDPKQAERYRQRTGE